MDKTRYIKKITIKLFGIKVYENIEHYDGIDLIDVEPINPVIFVNQLYDDDEN